MTHHVANLALASVLATLAACPPVPGPGPEPEPPRPPYNPQAEATCASVCEHWAELGCPEAEPSPGGETCEAVCERVQGSGIIEWNLACRAAIDSCDQVDSCED